MLVALFSLTGCRAIDDLFCHGAGCDWTDEEWTRVKALSPLPDPPADGSNKYNDNPAAIALGQQFYFDPRFSGNATLVDTIGNPVPYARAAQGQPINVACATCHDPKRAGADFTSAPNTVSIGAGWYDVNGQQTVNAAQYPLLYWNGRSDSLWSQAAAVSESGVSMNGTRLNTFWMINNYYRDDYTNVFADSLYQLPASPTTTQYPVTGKPDADGFFSKLATDDDRDLVTGVFVNWAKAIGAYERTLISRDSAFDQWVKDGPGSTWISPQAKRGARLFVGKASCIDCHNTPLFSDGKFHDIGVPQVGSHVPTVADCPSFSKTCDCTPGAEKGNCLPSGAWGGLKKLHAAGTAPASGGINYNDLRRNSKWSDLPDNEKPDYPDPTDDSLKGAWRTPSLRDVALTPPYMHDGYYRTLEDVLWHYNNGGAASGSGQFDKTPERAVQIKPLALTEDEVSDLVEFLKTLTGAPLATDQVVRPDASAQDASPSDGGAPDAPSDASSQ